MPPAEFGFVAELPALHPRNATQLLQTFAPFEAKLQPRPTGGCYLVVPSHPVGLRTSRLLKDFCSNTQFSTWQWRIRNLDGEGNAIVPKEGRV